MPSMDDYSPLAGRQIVAAPESAPQGTTVLVVTRGQAGVYRIEAASAEAEGLTGQRDVYECRTKGEARAWLAGNRWNPGGVIGRPTL